METKKSRELVKEKYNMSGSRYDYRRRVEKKGNLLSNYDIRLFDEIFPKLEKNQNVLEVGAGTGRFTLPALKKADSIVATDINNSLLEKLMEKIRESQYEAHCQIKFEDMFNLSFDDNTFDLVYSIHVIPRLMNFEDQTSALNEITRVIKPKGKLLFNYRNKNSLYGKLHKDFAPTSHEIEGVLSECGFKTKQKRGKWLITRRTLDILPYFACHFIASLDLKLQNFLPDFAWDVFVLAEKE